MSNGGRNGNRGRGRGARGGRGRGRYASKDTIECYKCKRLGHYQNECPSLEANYAEYNDEEEILLMAYMSEGHTDGKERLWFLDSGCSNHMCGVRGWFFDLDSNFRETVRLGDNSQMQVMGKGSVKLRINGYVQVLMGVYYIPQLKNNLISIGQLQHRGLKVLFQDDECRVYHGEKCCLLTSKMSGNKLFPISVSALLAECFQAASGDLTYLWHCRYGHLNMKSLKTLMHKEMVTGLGNIEDSTQICTACMSGKQHRESVPKASNWRATKPLELVHSDICGPITPESSSKKRYILTFIDDFSRKAWAYFLVEKSEALSCFKNFKAKVEKQYGNSICCLRTDRGGEFNSIDFNKFCEENGIER